ncbi:MAG: hypothetical protein AAF125_28505, partial [Chloroflexota bacterium]
ETQDTDADGLPDPIDPCPAQGPYDLCFYTIELETSSPLVLSIGESATVPVIAQPPPIVSSFIRPGDLRYEVATDDAVALGLPNNGPSALFDTDYTTVSLDVGEAISFTLRQLPQRQAAHVIVTWYDAADNNLVLAQDDVYITQTTGDFDFLDCQSEAVASVNLQVTPGGPTLLQVFDMGFRVYSTSGEYLLVGFADQIGW